MNKSDIMSRSVTVSSVGAATAAAAGAAKSPIVRSATSKLMKNSPLFSLVTGMNYTKDIFDATTVFTGILPKESLIMRNATPNASRTKPNDWVKTESDDAGLTSDTPGYRRYKIGSNSTSLVTANTSVVRSLIFSGCGNLNVTNQEKATAVPTNHVPAIVPGLPNLGNTCFVNALLQVWLLQINFSLTCVYSFTCLILRGYACDLFSAVGCPTLCYFVESYIVGTKPACFDTFKSRVTMFGVHYVCGVTVFLCFSLVVRRRSQA